MSPPLADGRWLVRGAVVGLVVHSRDYTRHVRHAWVEFGVLRALNAKAAVDAPCAPMRPSCSPEPDPPPAG